MASLSVVGAGHWGLALAFHLSRNGHDVRLWGHDPAKVGAMRYKKALVPHFPDIALPENLQPYPFLGEACRNTEGVFVAVPSRFFAQTLKELSPILAQSQALLAWGTKGLEESTGLRLDQVQRKILPSCESIVVSGPSFAQEVVAGLPTAVTVASGRGEDAETVAQWLRGASMRAYPSSDVVGVSLGGAIKNVIAIAAGISDGLGFGHNARAALITRGMAEMARLGVACGGEPQTFMGLAGAGDLVLTCTGDLSRNRTFGFRLGQGEEIDAVLASLKQEVEGMHTAKALRALAIERQTDMPIVAEIHDVLFAGKAPKDAALALMSREPRHEDG